MYIRLAIIFGGASAGTKNHSFDMQPKGFTTNIVGNGGKAADAGGHRLAVGRHCVLGRLVVDNLQFGAGMAESKRVSAFLEW
jgi:hypothetical protein